MLNITDKLYKFCMNRKLIEYPTSKDLLPIDIQTNIGIKFSRFNNLYDNLINDINHLKSSNIIINNYNNNSSILIDDNTYKELISIKHSITKSLYRITYEDYIYKFLTDINYNINILKPYYDKYHRLSNNNVKLCDYVYKQLISSIIFDSQESISIYNKYRCSYLTNLLRYNFNIEPLFYDVNSGSLYFTIPYSANKFNLKQIIGQLRNSDLIIDHVIFSIMLNDIGSLTKYYRYSKINTHEVNIDDQIDYTVPNIIRMLFKDMCLKLSNKKIKFTYNDVLHSTISKHLIYPEHYCQKLLDDYTRLNIPYKYSKHWELMSIDQIRKLTINDISLELLFNTYEEDIKVLRNSLALVKS